MRFDSDLFLPSHPLSYAFRGLASLFLDSLLPLFPRLLRGSFYLLSSQIEERRYDVLHIPLLTKRS